MEITGNHALGNGNYQGNYGNDYSEKVNELVHDIYFQLLPLKFFKVDSWGF